MDISFTNPDVLQAGITAGQATKMIVPFSYCAGDFLQWKTNFLLWPLR